MSSAIIKVIPNNTSTNMLRQTFAFFKVLSNETINPMRSDKAMHNFWCLNVKLNKRVLIVNLLNSLKNLKCGTNDVMHTASSMSKSSCRESSKDNYVKILMKEKLSDAVYDEGKVRRQFEYWRAEYYRNVKRNSLIDNEFQDLMHAYVGKIWKEGKEKNKNKINHLLNKWKPVQNNFPAVGKLASVKFRDEDLSADLDDKNKEPVVYGKVELSENASSVMRMNPKMMIYENIDEWNLEVEIEKGFTKLRYQLMRKNDENDGDDDENNEVCDLQNKVIDYAKLVATDLPTVQRLNMPKHSSIQNEAILSNLKQLMKAAVTKYRAKHCDDKGFPKSNLSKEEMKGMKELKELANNKECVIFKSDKSSKLTIDTAGNYMKAIMPHTEGDTVIDLKTVEKIEDKLNDHLKILNKIFNVGANTDRKKNQERINLASTSTNVPVPGLSGLRKDHKPVPAGQEDVGPKVRPVCSANVCPNARISHFLSKVINNLSDAVDTHYECRSSEEMRSSFEKFNAETDAATKKQSRLLSMDVAALYPSMSRENCKIAVKEMIISSSMQVRSINWLEAAKYVAVVCSKDEIDSEGLGNVIPKRVKVSRVKLTVNCLKAKTDDDWVKGDDPDDNQKKRLLALVVAAAVDITMASHVYIVGDTIFLQTDGGPIGLELTGALSRPFMMRWDRLYLLKVQEAGIKMLLYVRYIDDSNQIAVARNPDDDDETLAAELNEIANTVMDGIKMERDVCSKHDSRKLPILDMQCWLDDNGELWHTHYEKPIASKLVIPERSAHSKSSMRNVHVNELVRRMVNCSRNLDWDEFVAPILSEYMRRMMSGGYSEDYRYHCIRNAVAIYEHKLRMNDEGVTPLNRPREYMRLERRKAKKEKKKSWSTKGGYLAPVIVPSTPGGLLAKMLRDIAEKEACGLKLKVIERGGRTVEKLLSRSNPTASDSCGRPDCVGCNQPGGMRNCSKPGILYYYTCQEDNCMYKYIGESSNNFYTRSKQHLSSYNSKTISGKESSFIFKHQAEHHNGQPPNMKMSVIKSFKDPLSRQITESVHIFRTEQETDFNLMNTKAEWHQPSLYTVRNEIGHG